MPDYVYPMPPGSVIMSDVESSDQLAHTDTSSAPHAPPHPTGQSLALSFPPPWSSPPSITCAGGP